jgi:hypothetical protein
VFDEAVEELAEQGLFLAAEATENLFVAAGHEFHRGFQAFGAHCREAQEHAAAVARVVHLLDQALRRPALGATAGLALVQVGVLRKFVDGQRPERAMVARQRPSLSDSPTISG